MKKSLNNIFDEANANEIDRLVRQNAVPDISEETLFAIKEKVYAETNLKKEKKNNHSIWLRFGAIAACFLCLIPVFLVFVAAYDDGPEFYDPSVYPDVPKGSYSLFHPTAPMDICFMPSYSFDTLEEFYEYCRTHLQMVNYPDDPRAIAHRPFPAKEVVEILLSTVPEFSIDEISGEDVLDFNGIVYFSMQFSWKDKETGDVIATFDLRCNQEKPIDVYYDATCQYRMDHETFTVYRDNEDPLLYKVPFDSSYSCIFKISEQYENHNELFWSFLECCTELQTRLPADGELEKQWSLCQKCGRVLNEKAWHCGGCLTICAEAEEGSES